MYCVYIIKSKENNWFYVGFTNNVKKRLVQHNKGQGRSTNPYKPFKLVFVQIVNTRMEARDLEKYLKVKYNKELILAEVLELVDRLR